MTKLPISVFIITLNEEHNIARALDSIQFADEVIVVDSGSTDKTIDILESYGIKAIHNDWQGYAKQKQFAMEQCTNEWVFNLDADEVVSEKLAMRFSETISNDNYTSVRCARSDVFIGKQPPSLTRKANNRRFFKKSKAFFDPRTLVHESATIEGNELYVPESLIHYGYGNIEVLTEKKNQYSSLKAKEKHQKHKQFSYLKLIFIFPIVFIQQWLFQRKIFFGMRGFILSIVQAHYAFIKEAKLYELTITESNSN